MAELKYPVTVRPLSKKEGGGYLAVALDLPGCIADGDTPGAALEHVQEAIEEWRDEATRLGREIPAPYSYGSRNQKQRAQMRNLIAKQQEVLEEKDKLLESQRTALEDMRTELEALQEQEHVVMACGHVGGLNAFGWTEQPAPSFVDECILADAKRAH